MDEAREILGVQQEWLGFVDSGLPEGDPLPPLPEGCFALEDPELAAGRLVAKIRAFRPQVITTYDENGGYPHPDHIMTHTISMIAFDGAADAERFPEDEFGPVWTPRKLYYNQGFNRPRTVALHEALLARGMESPYGEWLERWKEFERVERTLTTHIPCRRVLRDPRQGADRARHADRPRGRLVPGPDGRPARGLADRGVRAGEVSGRYLPPRERPLRGHPRQCLICTRPRH
ncbi:mycothiol conjugate amidase Mca [Streptomyces sp. Ncost-T6T-2b]|nr:mycothiol conjugate amidase Mca [Streptomyces sp. Ncost-T6T-2b]